MPDTDCVTAGCLPAPESVWFLIAMVVVWVVVVVLAAAWGLVYLREHKRRTRRPAHQPVRSPQLKSALTVAEIQRRLAAEAAQPPPPVRNITVVVRPTPPSPPPEEQEPSHAEQESQPKEQESPHAEQESAPEENPPPREESFPEEKPPHEEEPPDVPAAEESWDTDSATEPLAPVEQPESDDVGGRIG